MFHSVHQVVANCRLRAGKNLYTGSIRGILMKTSVHPENKTMVNKDGKMLFAPMGNIELGSVISEFASMSDCFTLHIIIKTAVYSKYFSSKTMNMESKLGILV